MSDRREFLRHRLQQILDAFNAEYATMTVLSPGRLPIFDREHRCFRDGNGSTRKRGGRQEYRNATYSILVDKDREIVSVEVTAQVDVDRFRVALKDARRFCRNGEAIIDVGAPVQPQMEMQH